MSDEVAKMVERLGNPPFGTETSERLLMQAAADLLARVAQERGFADDARKEALRHQERYMAALEKAKEAMRNALCCTPSVIVPSIGGPEIIYDCGDPWAILRAACARIAAIEARYE